MVIVLMILVEVEAQIFYTMKTEIDTRSYNTVIKVPWSDVS